MKILAGAYGEEGRSDFIPLYAAFRCAEKLYEGRGQKQ